MIITDIRHALDTKTTQLDQHNKFIISLFLKILTDIHLGSKMFIFSLVARALRQSHCCPAQRADYAGHRQQRAG